ncbi:MAG: efflux RND transporter periplasmic adaptor subunit [Spirochaetales bacterium]|nr:efflux RND transporter periplasmic adaptor subunit [Spirochaetales bacterium]
MTINRRTILRAGIALSIVIAIIVITQFSKMVRPEEDEEPPIRPVKYLEINNAPSAFRRTFPGRLEASQTVDLSFLSGGDLVELPITEGQRLEQGALIARIDGQDAQNRFNAAQAEFVDAQSKLERNKVLYEEELIAQTEYETMQSAFEVALANYNTAQKALNDTVIQAPFPGVIAQRYVENFQKVQAGEKIVTYYNPEGFDIIIDIPESLVTQIPHYNLELSASFEQVSDKNFPLTVKEFATVADAYTKSYPLTLTMERPEDLLILPNMTVSVHVDLKRKNENQTGQYLVPTSAVVYDPDSDGAVVWIVEESTMTVTPTDVETGQGQGGDIIITEGLQSGDIVVVAGASFLIPGQKVQLLKESGAGK